MKKKERQKALALAVAEKIADALRSAGVAAPGMKVEVRVCGHKSKKKGRESKPRARGR